MKLINNGCIKKYSKKFINLQKEKKKIFFFFNLFYFKTLKIKVLKF